MVVLIGGMSGVHDTLLAAALRGAGVEAEPVPAAGREALQRGRAALPRGYPSTAYYLAGALLLHLEKKKLTKRARESTYLTLGCHFTNLRSDYRRALARAGFGDVEVAAIPFAPAIAPAREDIAALRSAGLSIEARTLVPLARAAILADVLVRAGCERRPLSSDPSGVDAAIDHTTADLARVLERRTANTKGPLRALARELERSRAPAAATRALNSSLIKVRITGEPFSALAEGDPSSCLIRKLESRGALVTPSTAAEWLLYLLWQVSSPWARRAEAALRRSFAKAATAAAVADTALPDMQRLANLAAPHYSTDLRGSSGHLETAIFLDAEHGQKADVVVSIKPFSSVPSSAISDPVLHGLAARARIGFLSIETTGDADAHVDSRLDLACDRARSARHRDGNRISPRS